MSYLPVSLFLNWISIATTGSILRRMSKSKAALVLLNIPFSGSLSILILRINHQACAGICSRIPAGSAPVSGIQTLPSRSETDIIYKLIQMSDMKSLTPTGTEGVAWMKQSVEPDSVRLCPIYCDAHRPLWKQHANLDFFSQHNLGAPNWLLKMCFLKVLSADVISYLLSLGCAVHLYSWGSCAAVNAIS